MTFRALWEAALVAYQGYKWGIPLQDSYDNINGLNAMMPMWVEHLKAKLYKRYAEV